MPYLIRRTTFHWTSAGLDVYDRETLTTPEGKPVVVADEASAEVLVKHMNAGYRRQPVKFSAEFISDLDLLLDGPMDNG